MFWEDRRWMKGAFVPNHLEQRIIMCYHLPCVVWTAYSGDKYFWPRLSSPSVGPVNPFHRLGRLHLLSKSSPVTRKSCILTYPLSASFSSSSFSSWPSFTIWAAGNVHGDICQLVRGCKSWSIAVVWEETLPWTRLRFDIDSSVWKMVWRQLFKLIYGGLLCVCVFVYVCLCLSVCLCLCVWDFTLH